VGSMTQEYETLIQQNQEEIQAVANSDLPASWIAEAVLKSYKSDKSKSISSIAD